MNPDEKIRFNANLNWATEYWRRKSKELKITDWTFGVNHRKTALGLCNYTKKKIFLSSYFLRTAKCNQTSIRNTILHEIAHALAGHKHHHDAYWKKIAIQIGCDGKVCSSMEKVPGKCFCWLNSALME